MCELVQLFWIIGVIILFLLNICEWFIIKWKSSCARFSHFKYEYLITGLLIVKCTHVITFKCNKQIMTLRLWTVLTDCITQPKADSSVKLVIIEVLNYIDIITIWIANKIKNKYWDLTAMFCFLLWFIKSRNKNKTIKGYRSLHNENIII